MTLSEIAKRVGKLAADNSPSILTVIGVTGTITTAYLTGRASFKAAALLSEESPHIEPKEKLELVWKEYIPAATTGLLTVAAIIGANRIGTRRAAALATAYTISERAFTEYREKIVEKLGKTKELAAREEIAQDRLNANPVSTHEVFIATGGNVLCYDAYSGRYFKSDGESLRRIKNELNERIINENYASLSDYYDKVGLRYTKDSEEVGWKTTKLLDLVITAGLAEDGQPCLVVDFTVTPVRDYYKQG